MSRALPFVAYVLVASTAASTGARAETILASGNGWQAFSTGRVNFFLSYTRGDGLPLDAVDASGATLHTIRGGGAEAFVDRMPVAPGSQQLTQGTVEGTRVRSGFVGNIFGFGIRRQLGQATTLTGFMAIWSYIESDARRKYLPVPADVREGYLKLEGPWGSLLGGRSLTLFSRGATQIDFLYGHGYGLGYPAAIDKAGPAAGQIGFGVLANGFASGIAYTTPRVAGFQLSAGYYDPSNIVGSFERTTFGRPEGELTWDVPLGSIGRIYLFGNGGWQKVFLSNSPRSETVWGTGYGGRIEIGPVHLGVAGHYGKGLGLYYALDPTEAVYTPAEQGFQFRTFQGYYAQGQIVLGRIDLSAGIGATRVYRLAADRIDDRDNDSDPATPAANDDADPSTPDPEPYSLVKQQLGINAGIVYHITDTLAFDVDYFRADFSWYLGERQVLNFVNSGLTMLW